MLVNLKLKLTILVIAAVVVGIFGVAAAWGEISQLDFTKPVGGDSTANNTTSNPEVDQLNQDIAAKKQAIDDLKKQQDAYQQAIADKQQQKADLKNQLAIFDNSLASIQSSIDQVKLDMEATQLEIKKLDLEISTKEDEIAKEKDQIAAALSLLYQEGAKTDIEILLTKDNFVEYLDQIKHLKDLNNGISASLDNLKQQQASLEADRTDQQAKQTSLTQLQESLNQNQQSLEAEKGAKQIVLDETNNSEAQYQKLLSQAKQQEDAAAADIANMEKVVRAKLAGNAQFNSLNTSAEGIIWPVPKNTITAYFHDPNYPFRQIFEHPAIDIKAAQGTPVHAAASGYVAIAKDGGKTGYSYIMLVHNDGLSTVYGHVSVIGVSPEDYVTQGQVIGMSGGMPGTHGAGPFTTGPHLHFEVRLNGIPVDPLGYLP
jgi:murein DD-endopeptidase MepM/ murein hydrolase activator NlpD